MEDDSTIQIHSANKFTSLVRRNINILHPENWDGRWRGKIMNRRRNCSNISKG
jgi:hypothetical protein